MLVLDLDSDFPEFRVELLDPDPFVAQLGHIRGVEHREREVAMASLFEHKGRCNAGGVFGSSSDKNFAVFGMVVLAVVCEGLSEEHAVLPMHALFSGELA